jgi:anti-sigma28 factor (negative regulator of flagellin synthesis)
MAAKKGGTSKGASIEVQTQTIPKMTINLPLDATKIAAIQRCIEKGTLRVTLNKVDLAAGRLGSSYLYD